MYIFNKRNFSVNFRTEPKKQHIYIALNLKTSIIVLNYIIKKNELQNTS